MPRYGLVKYDYNCLLNNYEIVKKKKNVQLDTFHFILS